MTERTLAMFPLESVLLPHTPLALRIFEERYLKMLGMLLETPDGEEPADFGAVLIERGSETGGGDERFSLGTTARLERVLPQEGRISVLARGRSRFEVVEWLDDAPYPRARIRLLPDLVWNDALDPLLGEAERVVRRVLARAADRGPTRWEPGIELADDPLARAWQIAAISPLGPIDQLELLGSTTAGGLLRAAIDLTLAAEDLLTIDGRGENPLG